MPHLLEALAGHEGRPARLDLLAYTHLPRTAVSAARYYRANVGTSTVTQPRARALSGRDAVPRIISRIALPQLAIVRNESLQLLVSIW